MPLPWVRDPPPAGDPARVPPPTPQFPAPAPGEPSWLAVSVAVALCCGIAAVLAVSALRGALGARMQGAMPEAYAIAGLLGAVLGFLLTWMLNPNRNLWTAFCLTCLMVAGTLAIGGYRASVQTSEGWGGALELVSGNGLEVAGMLGICLILLAGAILKDRRPG